MHRLKGIRIQYKQTDKTEIAVLWGKNIHVSQNFFFCFKLCQSAVFLRFYCKVEYYSLWSLGQQPSSKWKYSIIRHVLHTAVQYGPLHSVSGGILYD